MIVLGGGQNRFQTQVKVLASDRRADINGQNLIGLDYGYVTVEKLTLSGADRRINMSLMKISYSQGARN